MTHSRATGIVRLVLAVWLIVAAVRTLANPQAQNVGGHEPTLSFLLPLAGEGPPLGELLPVAALSFTLGVFLLTGFMSRVAGVVLVCLGAWEWINLGAGVMAAAQVIVGLYLVLRGGGAWAMDIYVQKVQERARQKEALN